MDSVDLIHDMIKKGEGRRHKGEGQGGPGQLAERNTGAALGLRQITVTILGQAPCCPPSCSPCLPFSHPPLLPKSILHIAAGVVCLKFKTELSPAQNLSTALRLQSCITCPASSVSCPFFSLQLTPFLLHEWPFNHNDLTVP